MAYSPTMIANNVLSRAFEEKVKVSPMKLQKILYFVASEYQKATQKELLEEPFSTWAYGPVVYSVYDEFRAFKAKRINRYARDARGDAFLIDEDSDLSLKEALDRIWSRTKKISAIDLSKITHEENSAWDKAFQSGEHFLKGEDIEADKTYYQSLGLKAG